MRFSVCLVAVVCQMLVALVAAQECEVCVTYTNKLIDSLSSADRSNQNKVEAKFRELCKTAKGKDSRFCYYVGGSEDAATGIVGELTKPVSWGMPADKVCEKLKKKDSQICELKYDKQIDLNKVNLKKLKVRELKKILSDWDEHCSDCLEKSDYIKYIEQLKLKHMPKSELWGGLYFLR